jgi:hypothetical protein
MGKNGIRHKEEKEESELSLGYCGKHGQVEIWTACKHLKDFPVKIYFSGAKEAVCSDCLDRVEELTLDDLIPVCIDCLRNIVKTHFEHAMEQGMSENDIMNMFFGLENLWTMNK